MAEVSAATADSSKAVVLYDGECPFCLKSVEILKRLDWLHILTYQNCREIEKLPRTDPPLEPSRMLEEMHLVTPGGRRVYHGYRAFRWMAWRLPLVTLLAPLMYLPLVPWLGQRAYLWVARRRYRLAPCRHGVCHVPPKLPRS